MADNNARILNWREACRKGDDMDKVLDQVQTANLVHRLTIRTSHKHPENKSAVHIVAAAGTLHSANSHALKKTEAQTRFVGSWTQVVGKTKAKQVPEDDIDLEDAFHFVERNEAQEDFEFIEREGGRSG